MSTVIAGKTFTARDSFTLTDTDGSGCQFTSGGVTFYGIYSENSRIFYADDALMDTYTKVYDSQDWEDDSYKTIVFDEGEEPISGDFETWFNAVYVEVTEDEVYLVKRSELESVANAIRTKGETSSPLEFPADFVSAINAIETGGLQKITISNTADLTKISATSSVTIS